MPSNSDSEFIVKNWPEDGIETISSCPVCRSVKKQVLYSGLTDRVFNCAAGSWQLNKCLTCGCGYLNPRPDLGTIHLAYREYYTHQTGEKNIRGINSFGIFRYMRHALANGYRNKRFGSKFYPAWKLGALISWFFPVQRKKLDRGLRNLPRFDEDSRLLDVGFGNAVFLKLAHKIGWKVFGADPDPVVVNSAREHGFEVRQGGIEAYSDMAESFDVITLSHVLEHIHDPHMTLEKAFKLLKPGGKIWIETPNIESYGHKYFGRNWRGLESPRHLIIFNWNSLEHLLQYSGFNKIQRIVNNNYKNIAKKSRALKDGKSPYDERSTLILDFLKSLILNFWTRFNHTKSEFITVVATKPNPKDGKNTKVDKS